MPACQIWSCHITQNANFENVLFCPNSTFNIGKVTKFLVESSLVQKLLGKNFMGWGGGGGNTLIPSASRVKSRDDLPPSKPFLIIVLQINIFFVEHDIGNQPFKFECSRLSGSNFMEEGGNSPQCQNKIKKPSAYRVKYP